MSGALDERNEEAQAALRVLVTDQVALLAEREKHLAIRSDEVSHLKKAVSELKQAAAHEATQLKTTISELKQASEHDVTHLKTVISELKQAAEREETHLKEVMRLEGQELQSRLDQLRDPARVLVHYARAQAKRALQIAQRALLVIARPLGFVKRAYLAIRYHYATDGWAGVKRFVHRRWVRWRERNRALKTPYQDQSDPQRL